MDTATWLSSMDSNITLLSTTQLQLRLMHHKNLVYLNLTMMAVSFPSI